MDKIDKCIRFLHHELHPKKLPLMDILSDISPMEFVLICTFEKYNLENPGDKVTVSRLAQEMQTSVPLVSRMLKNLEERSIVRRVTDESCRRNTFVLVSERGKEVLMENKIKLTNFLKNVLKHFSDEEIDRMIEFERKFLRTAEDELIKFKTNQTYLDQEVNNA